MLKAEARHVLPLLVLMPMLYSFPIMLVTAELATSMPFEGGSVAWIQEACGRVIGKHNKYWTWLYYLLDSSLYPRFAAGYMARQIGLDRRAEAVFAMAIVGAVTLIKLRGVKSVVKLSWLLSALSLMPSLLFLAFGLQHIDFRVLTRKDDGPETNWDDLLTWVMWLYAGVLSMGSVASEVDNPAVGYLQATGILLLLDVVFVNFTPLLVSLSVDPDREDYESGHFGKVAADVAGPWLSVMLTIGAQVSQIGLYNSVSMASDRYISSFFFDDPAQATTDDGNSGSFGWIRSCFGRFHRYLFTRDKAGVPPIIIFINASVVSLLVWLPITDTLNANMAIISISVILLLYSFLHLRSSRPHKKGAWRLPGGQLAAIVVVSPCFILSVMNIALGFTDRDNAVFWTISPKIIFVFGTVGVGALVHLIYWKVMQKANAPTQKAQRATESPSSGLLNGDAEKGRDDGYVTDAVATGYQSEAMPRDSSGYPKPAPM